MCGWRIWKFIYEIPMKFFKKSCCHSAKSYEIFHIAKHPLEFMQFSQFTHYSYHSSECVLDGKNWILQNTSVISCTVLYYKHSGVLYPPHLQNLIQKTLKRHQLSMTFHCLTKNTRKIHQKLMSFGCLLDWILKIRGLNFKRNEDRATVFSKWTDFSWAKYIRVSGLKQFCKVKCHIHTIEGIITSLL